MKNANFFRRRNVVVYGNKIHFLMDVKLLIIFKFIFWKLWYKHTFLNYLTTKVEKN